MSKRERVISIHSLCDSHVKLREKEILDCFIASNPSEKRVEKVAVCHQDAPYMVIWHTAFWVQPYIFIMKTLCLILGVTYKRRMVSPIIKHGVQLEKVKLGEAGNSPFTLKNYSVQLGRFIFLLPIKLVTKVIA